MRLNKLLPICFVAFATILPAQATFQNPLLPVGPDPWVAQGNGFYYYTSSSAGNLQLRRTRDITDLRDAERKTVWTAPETGPYSHDIWAPELHHLQGKWYLYFAADAGTNDTHRIYVLENPAADPLDGTWTFRGKVAAPTDRWAIDVDVFEDRGQMYMLWSGWEGANDGEQRIYIAHMSNPWTIDSERVMLSHPDHPWEEHGDLPNRHVNVNEGPELLKHGQDLFLIYSASGCWTDFYELGMLRAGSGSNLLDPHAWTKANRPVFRGDAAAGVYSPGHNGFFTSPDGKENWIIYHANPEPHEGCGNHRSPRIQRFTWNADGTPNFGTPVPTGTPLPKPSGTPEN